MRVKAMMGPCRGVGSPPVDRERDVTCTRCSHVLTVSGDGATTTGYALARLRIECPRDEDNEYIIED